MVLPDEKLIASASIDKTVMIWNYETEQCIYSYSGHTGLVNCLKFVPETKHIVSSSSDSTIHIWSNEHKVC